MVGLRRRPHKSPVKSYFDVVETLLDRRGTDRRAELPEVRRAYGLPQTEAETENGIERGEKASETFLGSVLGASLRRAVAQVRTENRGWIGRDREKPDRVAVRQM